MCHKKLKNTISTLLELMLRIVPANIELFKVNKRNTEKSVKYVQKLTINTAEWCQWGGSSAFIVNFEHISHLF